MREISQNRDLPPPHGMTLLGLLWLGVGEPHAGAPRPQWPRGRVLPRGLMAAFFEPINWHRTALHELGHASGHSSRLNRDLSGSFGSRKYAFEELVAEINAAFCCAALGIVPTVRHADYIGS